MNILKAIDTYFFGSDEEQEGYDKREKYWFYMPVSFGILVVSTFYILF